jgi:hypothetical protein
LRQPRDAIGLVDPTEAPVEPTVLLVEPTVVLVEPAEVLTELDGVSVVEAEPLHEVRMTPKPTVVRRPDIALNLRER